MSLFKLLGKHNTYRDAGCCACLAGPPPTPCHNSCTLEYRRLIKQAGEYRFCIITQDTMYLIIPDAQFILHSSASTGACACTHSMGLRKKAYITRCRAIESPRRGGHEHSKVKRPKHGGAK